MSCDDWSLGRVEGPLCSGGNVECPLMFALEVTKDDLEGERNCDEETENENGKEEKESEEKEGESSN